MIVKISSPIIQGFNVSKNSILASILGVSAISGTYIAINEKQKILSTLSQASSPLIDVYSKISPHFQTFSSIFNKIFSGTKQITSQYKRWGETIKSKTEEFYKQLEAPNFKNGFSKIVNKWEEWLLTVKNSQEVITNAIKQIWEYIKEWDKVKDLMRKIIPMLLVIFSYISSLFKSEALHQKEHTQKAQEAKKVFEAIKQAAQSKNKKTLLQTIWKIISENSDILTSINFSDLSRVIEYTKNEDKFIKKIEKLEKTKNSPDGLGNRWSNYQEFKKFVDSLYYESIWDLLINKVIENVKSITDCNEDAECKEEEILKDFGSLLIQKQKEAIDGVISLLTL